MNNIWRNDGDNEENLRKTNLLHMECLGITVLYLYTLYQITATHLNNRKETNKYRYEHVQKGN